MASKVFFIFCAQSVLIQVIFGYCIGNQAPIIGVNNAAGFPIADFKPALTIPGPVCGNAMSPANIITNQPSGLAISSQSMANLIANSQPLLESLSNGGVLSVSSGSQVAPTGITVSAENLVADGNLLVSGNLPFLGAVSVDGTLPAAGQGTVVYTAGPEVALTSGGCGAGLSGLVTGVNVAVNNLATFNGANIANLAGLNTANQAFNVADLANINTFANRPCGCSR